MGQAWSAPVASSITLEYSSLRPINRFQSIPELDPSCRSPDVKHYVFEYGYNMDLSLLKPFFDARVALVIFNEYKRGFYTVDYKYYTSFEGLQYIIKQPRTSKIEIIVFGDSDIVDEAKNIVYTSLQKTKQTLTDKIRQPPAYGSVDSTTPSAPLDSPTKEV